MLLTQVTFNFRKWLFYLYFTCGIYNLATILYLGIQKTWWILYEFFEFYRLLTSQLRFLKYRSRSMVRNQNWRCMYIYFVGNCDPKRAFFLNSRPSDFYRENCSKTIDKNFTSILHIAYCISANLYRTIFEDAVICISTIW